MPDSGGALNARLKGLNSGGQTVAYSTRHLNLSDPAALRDAVYAAYEARLAPPPDILAATFGILYQARTNEHEDSIAYIFKTYKLGPVTMCKAWRIVEHPYVGQRPRFEISSGSGGGIGKDNTANANPARQQAPSTGGPDASIVFFPCSPDSYRHVAPGSITTPLPRHP